jgi:hypothetical protein
MESKLPLGCSEWLSEKRANRLRVRRIIRMDARKIVIFS